MAKNPVGASINEKALRKVAAKYDISVADARKILKLQSSFFFAKLNEIALEKDLDKQVNSVVLHGIVEVRVSAVFMFENRFRRGRIDKDHMKYLRMWFSRSFKAHKDRISNLVELIKSNIDNDTSK